MEEEKKEIEVEEEPKEEVKAEPAQGGMAEGDKFVLITFILAVVSYVLCSGWIVGAIGGIVTSAIALGRTKKPEFNEATRNPYKVFARIAKPLAIVALVVSIIATILWLIFAAIIPLVALIEAAIEETATAAILVLF